MSKTQKVKTFIRENRAVLILVAIWAIVLAGFAILRHERLNSSVYDFGIKSQVIWNTANGHWFASSIEVTQYLGDHFQLIFLPLAALYRLWPNPNALLLVQSLLLALAAIPVYRIAHRRLRSQKLALAFAAVYLLYPTVGFINRFDFHPITFVVFFFLMAVDLVETDHPYWASFFIFLALITREEMGLTIFALGLFVIFVEKRPRLGAVWAVVGLAYSAIILFAVMPAIRGETTDSMLRYTWLGDSPTAMAQTLLTRPTFVLTTLLGDPVRQEFLLKILLPVGFLSLLSPLALAVALPALGYNLLSDVPSQSSIYFQYMSPLIPFIFLAAILGAATLQKWLNGRISPKAASRQFTWGLIAWLLAFTLLAWLLDNPFTTRINTPYYPVYALEQTSSRTAFDEARALLPPDAPVATMMGYGTHLSLRPELYLFYDRLKLMERPYAFPTTEYALLNLTDLRWDVNARIFYSAIETAIGRLGYEALYFRDDVVLLRQMDDSQPATGAVLQRVIDLAEAGGKYAPTAPSTLDWLGRQWVMDTLPDTPALSKAEMAVSQPIPFAEGITLLGYELSEDGYAAGRPLCVTLYWQADVRLTTDYTAFVHLTAPDGYVQAQRDSAPVFGFHPTSQWQPGEITADMHCFQIPPQLPPGPYQIKAGIYDPNTGSRLPIQDAAIPATDNAAILTEILVKPANEFTEKTAEDAESTKDNQRKIRKNPRFSQKTAVSHTIAPGDTWTALAYRYNLPEETLRAANPQMNRQRQPAIGTTIAIPEATVSQNGRLLRTNDGDLLATAVALNTSPWTLALQNGMVSPYRPPLYRPLYLPGGAEPPQDLPPGVTSLELSQAPAHPGQALGVRGKLWEEGMVTAVLDGNEMDIFQNGNRFIALTGTGAFYGSGQPELTIRIDDGPLWSQPWQFIDPDTWVYQQITLTGEAAQIDQESIAQERERLNAIWQQNSPAPQWQTAYQLPITDYLEITSPFGARRSYNGGPYRSYHEGVDFSAYGGTPVMAPAAGTVVLAEKLFVRGNAVIIDHGLGVYSGFYHMSEIDTAVGEQVQPGQIVGAVGTTGLSTGNHLHWDLLVDGIWVDGQAWLDQGMGCWILEGWGGDCKIGD